MDAKICDQVVRHITDKHTRISAFGVGQVGIYIHYVGQQPLIIING
jgi:hypothetical protein